MSKEELELTLLHNIRAVGLAEPLRQYHFAAHATGGTGKGLRKRIKDAGLKDWRFDFAWPEYRLAAEVEGGTWVNGAHVRPAYYEDNCRKYNKAIQFGWRVLRFTTNMVKDGEAVNEIEKFIRRL